MEFLALVAAATIICYYWAFTNYLYKHFDLVWLIYLKSVDSYRRVTQNLEGERQECVYLVVFPSILE